MDEILVIPFRSAGIAFWEKYLASLLPSVFIEEI